MRRVVLDFLHAPPAIFRWSSVVLLALAVLFLGDLARSYLVLDKLILEKEARLARERPNGSTEHRTQLTSQAPSAEELRAAQDTGRRLSRSWDNLFRTLEFAQNDNVALLTIEPDPEGGSIALTGEAKDYLAALSYVATLSASGTLHSVRLLRHDTKQTDPQRPLLITVTARWAESR